MNVQSKNCTDEIIQTLPDCDSWQQWLKTSAAAAPDFETLPCVFDLPPVPEINNIDQWRNLRKEYISLYHKYVFGSIPLPPYNLDSQILLSKEVNDLRIDRILLSFGPRNQADLNIEIIKPKGKGPFPVLLTQPFHKRWAIKAVERGYVACIYNGDDLKDDTKSYSCIWPDCDWSALTRRAFAASRSIDYLLTLDFIDKNKIAIIGHSRNGKQTLFAGAIDERISAVIPVSSGQGGACPARYFNESCFGESIEMITRAFPDWFCNNYRFFSGRENRLPVESNILLALIAPRALLICEAANDGCSSIHGVYKSYFSAKNVYKSLNAGDKIAVVLRQGGHGVYPGFIDDTLDWLDMQFGRLPADKIPSVKALCDDNKSPYPQYKQKISKSFDKLPDKFPNDVNQWPRQKTLIINHINSILGLPSQSEIDISLKEQINQTWRFAGEFVGRDRFVNDSNYSAVEKIDFVFENYIPAHIYKPKKGKKLPVVLWLSPACVPFGYSSNYSYSVPVHLELAKRGFAVLAFDPIGFGSRLAEASGFYDRNPEWSLLGKMIYDVQQAITALSNLDFIDSQKIYLLGYSLGARVALYTAAKDDRIAGVVCVAGLSPLRCESPKTGGIEKYYLHYPYIPNFAAFTDPNLASFDIHHLIAAVAPRRMLVLAAEQDYETNIPGLKKSIEIAAQMYNLYSSPDKLRFDLINEYNCFSYRMQNIVYDWFEKNAF